MKNVNEIARQLLRDMEMDNGCDFYVSPANLVALEAGVARMVTAGCAFTEDEIELLAFGEQTEMETFSKQYDGGEETSAALNRIFNGEEGGAL